jgi:hypothetical protein
LENDGVIPSGFASWMTIFFARGGWVFLQGGFENSGSWTWCFDGEFVVVCMAGAGFLLHVFVDT